MQNPDQHTTEIDIEEGGVSQDWAPDAQASAPQRKQGVQVEGAENGGEQGDVSDRHDRSVNVHEVERIASVILGAGLSLYAIKKLPLAGIAAALGAGALLYRGVSGHCHAYAALGVNTARGAGGTGLRDEPAIPLE